MKNKYKYSIVYASDCVGYAQDESYDFKTYKEAKLRLSNMDNKNDLTIIHVSDDNMHYLDGSRWIKLS
jgi:hypothetical protein